MKRTPIAALTLTAAALALTGCGGIEKDATYESVSDLREAVLSAELLCPGSELLEDALDPGQEYEFIKCGDGLELNVITGEDVEATRNVVTLGSGLIGLSYLEGPNWMVFSEDAQSLTTLQETLGGQVTVND